MSAPPPRQPPEPLTWAVAFTYSGDQSTLDVRLHVRGPVECSFCKRTAMHPVQDPLSARRNPDSPAIGNVERTFAATANATLPSELSPMGVTDCVALGGSGAESWFRTIQDASPDSCILLRVIPDELGDMREARVVYANHAVCQLMGRAEGSLDGRLLDEAFPGARSSGRYALYAEVYRTGVRRQLTFYHAQVGKWLRIVVVKVGDGFCIISADVSEQKAAEFVLQRSHDELERLVSARTRELEAARDLAEAGSRAKSDFLSRASHELRTPLNAIIGFSGVLLKNRHGQLGDSDVTHATRINTNGRQLLALVDDILDLSRIEAGRVDLNVKVESLPRILADVRDTLVASATDFGLTLSLEFVGPRGARNGMSIRTDAQRLRQVVLNLVGNAIKFTQRGGVIIRAIADAHGVPAYIEIADSGPGIKPQTLETMFEPFVIGDLAARGGQSTGLGLAISRSICALLGYRITASSVMGRGTIFTVDLVAVGNHA